MKSLLVSHVAAVAHESVRELRRRRGDFSLKAWDRTDWRLKKRTVDSVRFVLGLEEAPSINPIDLGRDEARLFKAAVRALAPFIVS